MIFCRSSRFFPATRTYVDRITGQRRRHHLHESVLQRVVKEAVLKAGIAHFWFVTLHPFEDGNGRISRAIADLALAAGDEVGQDLLDAVEGRHEVDSDHLVDVVVA